MRLSAIRPDLSRRVGMPARKKKRKQREKKLQGNAARFLAVALPADALFLTIPGGDGWRTNAPGYVNGTPDGLIAWPGPTLFLEFKDEEDGRVSDDQTDMHQALERCGARVAVCYRLEDVAAACEAAGIKLRARLTAGGAWVSDTVRGC